MIEPRSCYRCGLETGQALDACPRCGHPLLAAGQVRRRGWLLVGLGGFLVALMSAVGAAFARVLMQAGDPAATTRFTGTRSEAILVFSLFYLVWLFGLLAVVGGIWQIRNGRRNPNVVRVVLAIAVVLYLVAVLVPAFG